MSKTQESTNFKKTLELLNPNQRKAVDAIEGPVLVIAGPGTGKTQILSARIANLLQSEAQVQPDNILCLTFTNAGRTAMRQRLIQLTDTPTANAVHIHTFHSFCNDIIQGYPEIFDYDLKQIEELQHLELLQKVQDTIPKDSPIYSRRGKQYQLPRLKRVFTFIKKENLKAEELISALQEYQQSLAERAEFTYKSEKRKGELTSAGLREVDRIEKSIARISLFPIYQQLMEAEGYYDYADMIQWVNKALEQDEDFRFDLQEKYQYILIDEFQDTNGAQFRLAELLTEYEHHDEPNIFVVGDDDQSIYRFQGANMKNLVDFRSKYLEHITEVVLDENYRSSQVLLDGAQHVIEQNQNRLIDVIPGLDKNLKASNKAVAELGIQPRIIQITNSSQEYVHIAKDIQKKIAEGVKPSEIAVLYYKHALGNELVKYLSALGIPFFIHKELDFLQDPLAGMLINMLTYLHSESHEHDAYPDLLFQIMGYPFWGQASDAGFMILDSYRRHGKRGEPLRSYVHTWVEQNKQRSDLKEWEDAVIHIYQILDGLILDAQQQSLPVLINRVITQTGLHKYILERPNKFWNLEILKTLVNKADEVYDANSADALSQLLEDFRLMQESGITLPVIKLLGSKSGVNFITLHSSKGLEFPHVYMIGMNEHNWKDGKSVNDLMVPTTFLREYFSHVDTESDPEEKRRLFYVGLTRAQKTATLSLPINDETGNTTAAVRYVNELLESYKDLEPENVNLSPEEMQELEWSTLTQTHDMMIEPSEREVLEERLQEYRMSVTALYKYLECPVRFYYDSLLQVPSGRSLVLDFGNLVHDTLEKYYIQAKAQGEHLGVEKLIEIYDREVARNDAKFINEEAQEEIKIGREDLTQLYKQEILGSSLDVDLEEKLEHTFDHGLTITGKIDKVEVEDNHINIIDYKTGKPEKSKVSAPKMNTDKEPKITSYWFQGLFYKLLAEKTSKYAGKHVKLIQFDFLTPQEDGSFLKVPVEVTEQQYDYTMERVYEAWEKIKKLEFSQGCGDKYCYWCEYQKSIDSV